MLWMLTLLLAMSKLPHKHWNYNMRVASSSLPHHSLKYATFAAIREINEWKMVVNRMIETTIWRIENDSTNIHSMLLSYHFHNYTYLHPLARHRCLLDELKICREIEFIAIAFGGVCRSQFVYMWFTLQKAAHLHIWHSDAWNR